MKDSGWSEIFRKHSPTLDKVVCSAPTSMYVSVDVHNSPPSLDNEQKKKDENNEIKTRSRQEEEEETHFFSKNRGKSEKKTIFIGGIRKIRYDPFLDDSNIKDDLLKHFSNFGEIKDIEIIKCFFGFPMFAFITYENEDDMNKVLDAQDHTSIDAKHHKNLVTVRKYI